MGRFKDMIIGVSPQTPFLSLFPAAGKVTKRAAAAEKEAKNQFAVLFKEKNSPDLEPVKFQAAEIQQVLYRDQTAFLLRIFCQLYQLKLIFLTLFFRGGTKLLNRRFNIIKCCG